ncbi:MAG: S41 family peptidase [Lentimicrobium sp.]|jgi:hypothetical protein|nr:S41 family peptidase [Lentimicrobium sp.]
MTTTGKIAIITFMLLLCQTTFSQQLLQAKDRILSKDQMIADYKILYTTLINYHPTPFLYTSESDLNAFFSTQLSTFDDSLTEREFHLIARKLIVNLKCGHTFCKPSDEWYSSMAGKNVLLPFNIRRAGNKAFIDNTIDKAIEFVPADEILAINDVSIQTILEEMSNIQERDGYTQSFANENIIKKFHTYYLFLYPVQDNAVITFKDKEGNIKRSTVKLSNKRMNTSDNSQLPERFRTYSKNSWSSLSIDTTNNNAYLRIKTFSNRNEFRKYYKEVFSIIADLKSPQLIIDLRDNTGGYFGNGNELLTYLTPNKFEFNFQRPKRKQSKNKYTSIDLMNRLTKLAFSVKPSRHKSKNQRIHTFTYKPNRPHYDGNINVITNGVTFSQAALVAAHLKHYGATFYGTETGGAENATNSMVNYKLILPNSRINVFIPYYQIVSNSTNGNIGYGVKPDIEILPDTDIKRDNVLLQVIELKTSRIDP